MRDIENIVNDEEIRKEVEYQNGIFNLFDFYDEGKDTDYIKGALHFITPLQSFNCFSNSQHAYVIENVCSCLYSDFYEIFKKYDYEWRDACRELGVICFQLISKGYSLVWMPYKINEFQKEQLISFYNDMCSINEYLVSNGYNQVNIYVNYKNPDGKISSMFIDEAVKNIDTYVSNDVSIRNEYIINNTKHKSM